MSLHARGHHHRKEHHAQRPQRQPLTVTAAAGVGVLAENTAGGIALRATGPVVFSRSGLLTVAAGSRRAR